MMTILFLALFSVCYAEEPPGNLTDLSVCKVSHFGLEYTGNIAKTESNVRCQSWTMDRPHKINENLTDEQFPYGSKKVSKNYCRNPDRRASGPWCYSMNDDLLYETCAIPLCSYSQCKLTGPGMEYGGFHRKGASGKKCLKWDKERKKVFINGNFTKFPKFEKDLFPENSLSKAKKFCRNPDGDLGGLWCFVENDDTGYIEKDYCDIPFCEDPECSVFTKNYDTYMHYSDFNGSFFTNLTFGIKLWDSDSINEASARLVMSVLALPLTGKQIHDAGIGVEIFINNKHAALRWGNKDKPEYEPTVGYLKSTNFTYFSLSWDRGFITLNREGQIKPIFLAEIKTKKTLMSAQRDRFDYYSAQGTNVIWDFPFNIDDDCDVHTTTGNEFQQFWPLREKDSVFDLQVFIRSFKSGAILIVPTPVTQYPYFKIVFRGPNNYTRLTVKEYEGASEVVLKEIQLEGIVDYWQWSEFSVSFFANSLQIYMKKAIGMHSLLESKQDMFRVLRWFSVSSDNSVSHWSFFCQPPVFYEPPAAFLPECALNPTTTNYQGTQDLTSEGVPCMPWSSVKLLPDNIEGMFSNASEVLASKNYCRDPNAKGEGAYCYTISRNPSLKIEKSFCHLRKCKSDLCKMAGTGNDFIGQIATTRSNRTCDYWVPTPKVSIHFDHMWDFNGSYFADQSAQDAKNYCRNPIRDISGSWCYTTDPEVVQDICNVRDCDRPEERVIVTSTTDKGRKIYILPQWKEEGLHGGLRFGLKQWNPDLLNGIAFFIFPKEGNEELKFVVGAAFNEKVELYYNTEQIQVKTFPHLISAGKWTDFWLQIRRGEIMFGFEGVPTALFEWRHKDMSRAFEPVFMTFTSLYVPMPIGVFLKHEECHTENTTDNNFLKFFPIGLWSQSEQPAYKNLTLKLRGTGVTWISLMWIPETLNSYQIKLDNEMGTISFNRVDNPPREKNPKITLLLERPIRNLMTPKNWTKLDILWTERTMEIKRNNVTILQYQIDRPMLIYWFSVACASGWATWSANCEPLDLDGPPRDGGWSAWSSWTCSVSCGGGEGFRTRTCSNPHPNIFGKLCEGSPTATGICNDFPCGDISTDTLEKIQRKLRTEKFSYVIDEDSPIVMTNQRQLLKIVKKESPDAFFEWTHNGVFINSDERRYIQGDDIKIQKVKPSDAGLYVCMIYRINKRRVILKVISLAVRAKKFDLDTRATYSYIINCNSVLLGYIYTELSLKLVLNNDTYVDHGITVLAAVNSHELSPLNRSHTGVWQCIVEQKDLRLSWVTNYLKINVKKRPNFYTHLMEDKLTKPFFGWMKSETSVLIGVILIIVVVVLLVVAFLIVYFKFCTMDPRSKRNRRFKK